MALKTPRRFEFPRDAFAFANELFWEYHFDRGSGKTLFRRREPAPNYAHRCFVLARTARQFLYHARFDPSQKVLDADGCRRLIRAVVARDPRQPCPEMEQIVVPGYAGLRELSIACEALLKAECGGAWRSYILRSHWRMIFPISRGHQQRTAESLAASIRRGFAPIIHLVKFPSLTINHGMILFDLNETRNGLAFMAYDPNDPSQPAELSFNAQTQTFSLPQNVYWAGGALNVIEIYCGWFL